MSTPSPLAARRAPRIAGARPSAAPRAGVIALLTVALTAGVAVRAHAQQLRVFGNTTTIELAPVLLAAKDLSINVKNGGIPDLFDEDAADLATNAETQALRQSVEHPDLRIIFTVSEGFYRVVARRSAGIQAIADLRGKRIATAPNTSSAYYLFKTLALAGLTMDDVTIVPVAPLSLMPAALANREVDALTIWEPEIERAAAAVGDDAIEFQDRRVYRELFNLNTTAANLADPAKRRAIVAFVRALIRASAQVRERPQDAWPLVAASTGYDPALIEKVWHHEGYPGTLVADLLDVMVAEDVFVAKERNRTPRTRAELAKLIDDSVLRDALRD
jgi:sulfonate transport system substrate-binding protein